VGGRRPASNIRLCEDDISSTEEFLSCQSAFDSSDCGTQKRCLTLPKGRRYVCEAAQVGDRWRFGRLTASEATSVAPLER
jgi:hypothetical protein